MKGLIHIYEGDGKGKTSAGVGLAVRCAGSGQKVLYTQFLKDSSSSEINMLNQMNNIQVKSCEKSFGFTFLMNDEEKKEASAYYANHLKEVLVEVTKNEYKMLVLDEIIASYNLKLIDCKMLISFLKNKPESLEIVMTGRDPDEELVKLSDYVSRIVKEKHPFDKGVKARLGIEY